VIPEQGHGADILDEIDAFVGIGTVTDRVSEADAAFHAHGFHGLEDPFEGFEIAVNIGVDAVFHTAVSRLEPEFS